MVETIKAQIRAMRLQGIGYKNIAKATGINVGTIKTFCIRHDLSTASLKAEPDPLPFHTKQCEQCGKLIYIIPGRKVPRFCCNACRNSWWNKHINECNRDSMIKITCPTCGKRFSAYERKKRKYCSHSCYITARFG